MLGHLRQNWWSGRKNRIFSLKIEENWNMEAGQYYRKCCLRRLNMLKCSVLCDETEQKLAVFWAKRHCKKECQLYWKPFFQWNQHWKQITQDNNFTELVTLLFKRKKEIKTFWDMFLSFVKRLIKYVLKEERNLTQKEKVRYKQQQ